MNNDSSKTNVLDLIKDHMNNSTPFHLRSAEEPSTSSSAEVQEAYPSQEAKESKKKASSSSSSYPSQEAKTVIDVDSVSRSESPPPGTSANISTTTNPRRQRRRRRFNREQQQQQQQGEDGKPAAQVRRVNTLPCGTTTSNAAAPESDEQVKARIARSMTGPIPTRRRVGATVEIEMGDESELDILKDVVALRASDTEMDHSSSGSGTSSSSDSSSSSGYYDEEAGCIAKRGEDSSQAPSRASINAVQYIMNDMSGTSIPGLKTQTMSMAQVTVRASPAMASGVAGAYAAAPGQGYVRADSYQAGVLGRATMDGSLQDCSLQYSSGGAIPQEQARRYSSRMDASNKSHDATPKQPVISAVRVDEDDLELHIREQITSAAAQAEVVDLEKETETIMKGEIEKVQRKYVGFAALAVLFIAVVIVAVAVSVTKSNGGSSDTGGPPAGGLGHAQPAVLSTLHSISQRGHLHCGLSKRDENVHFHPEYEKMWKGFNGDWCRAIAAAALDGDVNVTIHDVTESERWEALSNGTLDVLVTGTPASTESLHFDLDREVPAIFSTPFLFDGVGVGGQPQYIKHCATTKGFENYAGCRSVRVCACQGSGALEVFQKILHPSQVVEVSSLKDVYSRFTSGCCNMIATDWSNERAEVTLRQESGYNGSYALGEALYSKQPYALSTRKAPKHTDETERRLDADKAKEDDPQVWSEFVDWVLQSLIAAEQSNITQATAHLITETEVFGDKYRNAFKHAVGAVGNYGEVYERNMGHVIPRDGMNLIADGSTGLHYHRSIGDVTDFGTLNENGTIAAIKERGKLKCGVPFPQNKNFTLEAGEVAREPQSRFLSVPTESEEGYAVDMEYCRALASAVFQGLSITNADADSCLANNDTEMENSDARIEFVFLPDRAEGYTQLNEGDVDVISGYRLTLAADVQEPTTGKGYTFSQPYLYGPVSEQEHVTANNRCMVTRQEDQQWADFVQVVVMALFYAEEHHIDQPHANAMPYVNLFGPTYKRMMKDAIFAVGNYGEVYQRLVEPYLHRAGGPNTLNAEADPQLCSFPGPII